MAERNWMYNGWHYGSAPSDEWIEKTNMFLDHAFSIPDLVQDGSIKCPCGRCRNYMRHTRDIIEAHLCKFGFKENYETWTAHGEEHIRNNEPVSPLAHEEGFDQPDRMDEMLHDIGAVQPPGIDEEPTSSASAFYRMVDGANESVHDNTMHTSLSAIARLLALKSEYNMSIAHYDDTLQLIHELLPPDSKLAEDFYHSKKLLQGLGITYIKIDVCYNDCMLYYKENEHKDKCDFCNTPRFEDGQNKVPRKVLRYLPITDRL